MHIKKQYITDLLEENCSKFPTRFAVKDKFSECTYLELKENAIKIADTLIQKGVKSNETVVLLTQKNVFTVICFWGIIYAGGIPVLLDFDEGYDINKQKIKSLKPNHIILKEAEENQIAIEKKIGIISETILKKSLTSSKIEKQFKSPKISETCYMMTTSGTTGLPKVIQVSHSNLLHYIENSFKVFDSPLFVNSAHVTNFSTDLGFTNVLISLYTSGLLRIFDELESKDPHIFKSILKSDNINFIKTTPSHIDAMIPFFKEEDQITIDKIVLGGEKLPWKIARKIKEIGICNSLFNHYGPSETTIGVLIYPIKKLKNSIESVPIGKPFGEGKAYLVNIKNNIGELYIEGPGVTSGYYNNQDETKEKFFVNELTKQITYRTGDICKIDNNGNFIFLNRNDRQIKVKGYRVELDEIEKNISLNPEVEYTRVNTFINNGRTCIEAFVKTRENSTLKEIQVKEWLKSKLPFYKIPEKIYLDQQIVYTGNGKIDFNSLRGKTKTKINNSEIDFSNWEKSVLHCWEEIFGLTEVDQNFFELGGDSLSAINFIGKLQMLGFNTTLFDLNENPELSKFISLDRKQRTEANNTHKDFENLKLTSSQFEFLKKDEKHLDYYLQTGLFEIIGDLNSDFLSEAVYKTVEIHKDLSLKFFKISDKYFFENNEINPLLFEIFYLRNNLPIANQIIEITKKIASTICLQKGIIFKVALFKDVRSNKNYFFIACHHLIVDAISWKIILNEILSSYELINNKKSKKIVAESLRTVFYNTIKNNDSLEINTPKGLSQIPNQLPADIDISNKNSRSLAIIFPKNISQDLKNNEKINPKGEHVSNVLLSCFISSLYDFYEINKISIDVEFHGRPKLIGKEDVSSSVSWWSTTFPLDFNIKHKSAKNVANFVSTIAEYANTINSNPDIFETQTKTKSDIRFNFLGEFPESFKNPQIKLIPSTIPHCSTRSEENNKEYKIFFTSRFIDNELITDLQFSIDDRFTRSMREFATLFSNKLIKAIYASNSKKYLNQFHLYENSITSVGKSFYRLPVPKSIENKNKFILLTGSTGFLGSHILNELLEEKNTVVCLVRSNEVPKAKSKLLKKMRYYFPSKNFENNSSLKVVVGDLTQENLGMSSTDYKILSEMVDVVVHSAADVNLTKSYEELYNTNIYGTKQIIDFAKKGKKKKLHYLSTLAVSGLSQEDTKCFSESDFNIGQQFISSYEKSKYEAENLLKEEGEKNLDVIVYRVGHIAGNSITAKFQKNSEENRIIQILKGILSLKKVPDLFNEKISFSHVDIVSKMLVAVVTEKVSTSVNCLHLENPNYYSIKEILLMLDRIGYPISIVSNEEFKNSILFFEGGEDRRNIINRYSIWVNRHVSKSRNIVYDSTMSNDFFSHIGIVFPTLNEEWLKMLIDVALSNKPLEKKGKRSII